MTVSSNRHGLKRGFDPLRGLGIFRSDFRVSFSGSHGKRMDQCL